MKILSAILLIFLIGLFIAYFLLREKFFSLRTNTRLINDGECQHRLESGTGGFIGGAHIDLRCVRDGYVADHVRTYTAEERPPHSLQRITTNKCEKLFRKEGLLEENEPLRCCVEFTDSEFNTDGMGCHRVDPNRQLLRHPITGHLSDPRNWPI